ncbi:MAG: cupin domain-containing protein [Bacteroidota bacterium]
MAFVDFNTQRKIQVFDGFDASFFHSGKATIAYFTIDGGCDLPEHSHPHEQWSNVIEGELEFTIDGETEILKPGMTAFIPPNAIHSARALKKCKVIDFFVPVREDFKELEANSNKEL